MRSVANAVSHSIEEDNHQFDHILRDTSDSLSNHASSSSSAAATTPRPRSMRSRLPQDLANRRTGVAVLAEQFDSRGDQSSTALRNAVICGLAVIVPHQLTPWVDVAAASIGPAAASAITSI